nr:tRNA-dihydrouridine synthase family protein [Lachnospiraceae bacterium]
MCKIYFAPMEGVTGYIYRNTHNEFYDGVDKYYMPFLSANHTYNFQKKEKKDFAPENNQNINVVPQILTNKASEFIWAAKNLREFGYEEVNINLGCPASTVVSKGKGAGFLAYPSKLEDFLYEIYSDNSIMDMKISVKCRAGRYFYDELEDLMDIFDEFPIYELIIHPRVQKDMYKGKPNLKVFEKALDVARFPVVYNGDIFTLKDYIKFKNRFPQVKRIMIGRGLVANPELAEKIKQYETKSPDNNTIITNVDKARLRKFHDRLINRYVDEIGEGNSLLKMKEIWNYMYSEFPENTKEIKAIRKTKRMSELV